jgi:hypothetical protein
VDGRRLHVRARDTVPAAGLVVLHRIGTATQGPADSVRTSPEGRYAFRVRVDSLALYLLSSHHDGIEYFSSPLRLAPGGQDTTSLMVHDTSSTAPISVAGHFWVVGQPTAAKRRPVLDLVLLRNAGTRTRVARDSLGTTWMLPLPAGAADVEAGEGELSETAVEPRGDSLAVLSPLVPGQRQLVFRYTIPLGTRLVLPVAQPAESLIVLLQPGDGTVRTKGFAAADSQAIEGRMYRRWAGAFDQPGEIEVRFADQTGSRVIVPLVALLALALGVLAAFVLRRQRASPAPVPAPAVRVSRLVEEIARLDAAYAGREREVDADTWRRYQADRARLRHELDAALAIRGTAR